VLLDWHFFCLLLDRFLDCLWLPDLLALHRSLLLRVLGSCGSSVVAFAVGDLMLFIKHWREEKVRVLCEGGIFVDRSEVL